MSETLWKRIEKAARKKHNVGDEWELTMASMDPPIINFRLDHREGGSIRGFIQKEEANG